MGLETYSAPNTKKTLNISLFYLNCITKKDINYLKCPETELFVSRWLKQEVHRER